MNDRSLQHPWRTFEQSPERHERVKLFLEETRKNPIRDAVMHLRVSVKKKLGQGGRGSVWQMDGDEGLALKEFDPFKTVSPSQQQKFSTRIASSARIWDHMPMGPESSLIIMDEIPGVNLSKVIEACSEISEEVRLKIAHDILGIGEELENEKLCHGDIKPENIRIDLAGSPRIIDFDTIQPLEKDRDALGGTAAYAAPEILDGRFYEMSDIFSIGLVILGLFLGKEWYKNFQLPTVRQFVFFYFVKNGQRQLDDLIHTIANPAVRDVLLNCIRIDHNERSSASSLKKLLTTTATLQSTQRELLTHVSDFCTSTEEWQGGICLEYEKRQSNDAVPDTSSAL